MSDEREQVVARLLEYVQHKDDCEAWPRFTSHFQQATKVGACTCGLRDAIAALSPAADAVEGKLRAMADDWIRAADDTRLNRGQHVREKRGHEVLASCAYALRDALGISDDAPPAGKKR